MGALGRELDETDVTLQSFQNRLASEFRRSKGMTFFVFHGLFMVFSWSFHGLFVFLLFFVPFYILPHRKGGLGSAALSTSNMIKPSCLLRKRKSIPCQLWIRNPIALVSMQPTDPSEHPFPRACWMCSLYKPAGLLRQFGKVSFHDHDET